MVSSFGAMNSSATGGGVGASAAFPLFHKHLDLGFKAVGGDGIGRYGGAQLVDATARPDGSLALIRTAHGLVRAEVHPTPKLGLCGYWGLEFAWRAGYSGYDAITITKTTAIPATTTTLAIPATTTTKITTNGIGGYGNVAANNSGCATEGVPVNDFNPSSGSNCAGDIRLIQEGTLGFWTGSTRVRKVAFNLACSIPISRSQLGPEPVECPRAVRQFHPRATTTWCGLRSAITCHNIGRASPFNQGPRKGSSPWAALPFFLFERRLRVWPEEADRGD